MSDTPYGNVVQFNASNNGKGKYQAVLAKVYAHAFREAAAGREHVNNYSPGTKRHKAWSEGWSAGIEFVKTLQANKAAQGREK